MINYFSTHQIIMWKGSQGKIEDPSKNLLFKFICQTAKKYKKKVMREKENGKKWYLTVEWSLPSKLMIIFLSLVIFLFKNLLCVSSSLLNLCLAVKNCFFYTVVREFAEKKIVNWIIFYVWLLISKAMSWIIILADQLLKRN